MGLLQLTTLVLLTQILRTSPAVPCKSSSSSHHSPGAAAAQSNRFPSLKHRLTRRFPRLSLRGGGGEPSAPLVIADNSTLLYAVQDGADNNNHNGTLIVKNGYYAWDWRVKSPWDSHLTDEDFEYPLMPDPSTYLHIKSEVHTLHYMYTYMHACMHTYIHTYIHDVHIYIHTYIHTYIHIYTHTYIHTYIHTYTHTYIHTYIHGLLSGEC